MLLVNGFPRDRAKRRVDELLERVGLPLGYAQAPSRRAVGRRAPARRDRPHARGEPKLIVCDEPVSALDVSVQAQILNLFRELREEFGLRYLFITHDLAVVRQVADRVYVLHNGLGRRGRPGRPGSRPPGARVHPAPDRLDPSVGGLRCGTQSLVLGAGGPVVTRLGLGGSAIGGLFAPVTDDEATLSSGLALELGITYVDTAPLYGLGASERRLGERSPGRSRETFTLSTKVGRCFGRPPGVRVATGRHVARKLPA